MLSSREVICCLYFVFLLRIVLSVSATGVTCAYGYRGMGDGAFGGERSPGDLLYGIIFQIRLLQLSSPSSIFISHFSRLSDLKQPKFLRTKTPLETEVYKPIYCA
jgi:hypothetical protein